jgi:hypothetical protein
MSFSKCTSLKLIILSPSKFAMVDRGDHTQIGVRIKNSRQIRELALSCLALLAENGDPIITIKHGACERNYREKNMEKTVMR